MKYEYNSLCRKYCNILGITEVPDFLSVAAIKNKCVKVTLPTDSDHVEIRDWCETQFVDDWVYVFEDYYFKNPQDATAFSLRWA